MTSPREREEAIFSEALALPTVDRPRFLSEACGTDSALRARIEIMLGAHDSAGGFMEVAPLEASGASAPAASRATETPGSFIGRYKLLQKIGEGGCGVVWMAEQEEPVRRRVAIKVIKLGMDTREVVARFEAERQALARMDHPNIARVLDAGASDSGRPFFVMELVRGVPITKFCDEAQLTPAARMELFLKVCSAVQHAHHKGVIHRDLKPSNILVTLHDSEAVPKVIDFGIAKATQGRLTDQTLFTAFEQFIGTPAYMSPEQAEMSGLDIDTRSDIYSLGVLLYELLAGRPPFDPQSLVQAGLDEVRRIIREVEPPRPSTNLSTLNDSDRRSIARLRGTDPAGLSLLLRGDLDWIIMKAMEKNRARRYETPTAFAADIAHYLHHEPVTARPPSRLYRLGKMLRRNRLVFASMAAIVIVMIAGTIVSSVQAVRAWRAERAAGVERLKAQRARARAEDLISFMVGDLRTSLEKVGRLDVLQAVGDKSLTYFASLEPGELDDATRLRRAKTITQIGAIRMSQARYDEAADLFGRAYAGVSELVSRHPADGAILLERGQAEYWNGFLRWKRGDLAGAAEWLTRYRDTSQELVRLDPARTAWQSELAHGQHNLAVLRKDRGDLEGSRQDFLGELATLEKLSRASAADLDWSARMADARSWLGEITEQQGKFSEALKHYVAQAALIEQLMRAEPKTLRWQHKMASALLFQADILLRTGQVSTAAERVPAARRLIDSLTLQDAANRRWQAMALQARLQEVLVLRAQGEAAAALQLLEATRPAIESLATAEPTDRSFALRAATARRVEAQLRASLDRPDAGNAAARAVELGEILLHTDRPSDAEFGECATACIVAGEIAARAGNFEASNRQWQRAAELLEPRLATTRDWHLLDPAARAALRLGRATDAHAWINQLRASGYLPLEPWPE